MTSYGLHSVLAAFLRQPPAQCKGWPLLLASEVMSEALCSMPEPLTSAEGDRKLANGDLADMDLAALQLEIERLHMCLIVEPSHSRKWFWLTGRVRAAEDEKRLRLALGGGAN